jgi:hypothetical protein
VHRHERLRKLLRAAHALGAMGPLALAATLSVILPARARPFHAGDGNANDQTRTTLFPVPIQMIPSEVYR